MAGLFSELCEVPYRWARADGEAGFWPKSSFCSLAPAPKILEVGLIVLVQHSFICVLIDLSASTAAP